MSAHQYGCRFCGDTGFRDYYIDDGTRFSERCPDEDCDAYDRYYEEKWHPVQYRAAMVAMSRFLSWVYLERLSHVRLELRPDLWDIHRERAVNLCDFGKALGLRLTWSDS